MSIRFPIRWREPSAEKHDFVFGGAGGGGQSTRMGSDKALLQLPGSGLPLWRRQWHVLQALEPEEMLWSGFARPELPADIRLVADKVSAAGPIAGVNACLEVVRSDFLVVLAIDLPHITSAYLRGLLEQCSPGCGVVARNGDFFEPLAAIYPRQLAALSSEHLAQGRYAMQDFVREAIRQGALREIPIEEKDASLFKNLNSPADLTGLSPQRFGDE